jgi:tetratricopeptide (TPR) repeat protein
LQIWDELFVLAEELDWNHRGLLNYSSLAFRELLDLEEARRRSEHALELSPPGGFGMPRMFARSDLIQTELLAGDFGQAQEIWSGLWEDAQHVAAWTNWLIRGRLLAGRAEIALRTEGPEAAIEWASRSLEIALRTRRKKYEVVTRRLLGEALTALGRRKEATAELRNAVALADELVNPPARWQALAALARTLYTFGEDEGAEAAFNTAGELIRSFAETLAPPRAQHLLDAGPIREILSATPRAALSER